MTNNDQQDEQQLQNEQTQVPQLVISELDNILLPIGGGSRVKYTCLDVSKRYLALGANTGSLYFFERKSISSMISKQQAVTQQLPPISKIFTNENLSFTQILSLNDIRDQISIIKINPCNDNLVAVSTHKTLYIIEPNISIRREKEKILVKMTDHPKDAEITTLIWSHCGKYLFSGDDIGNIYCCSIVKARKSFFFSGDFVYKCDSKLIQLDIIPSIPTIINTQLQQDIQITTSSNSNTPTPTIVNTLPLPNPSPSVNSINISILSSTLTKSIVVNFQILTATNVGKVSSIIQIGKKLRENTKQGACFHPFYKSSVYTSRPGKRLWLADPIDGKVLSTMNFTPPTSNENEDGTISSPVIIVKPKPLISSNNITEFNTIINGKFPMIFSKLLPFGNYLISFDENSLLLIDVNEVEVLEWKMDQNQIHDLVVYHDSIYALHGQNRSVSRIFTSIPLEILPTPQELQEQFDQQQQQNDQQQESNIVIEQPIETVVSVVEEKKEEIHINKSQSQDNLTISSNGDIDLDTNTSSSIIIDSNNNGGTTSMSSSLSSSLSSSFSLKGSTDQLSELIEKETNNNNNNINATTPLPKVASKENMFSDIQLSSEPLMVSTTVKDPTLLASTTTRKVLKKKVIKVPTPQPQDQSISNVIPTTTTTITPPPIITTTTTPTGEVKRTVIVKKKVIKKAVSTSSTTAASPLIANPTPTPSPPTPIETVSIPTTTTTSESTSPLKKEDTSSLIPNPTSTTNNIQQGIFKTLNSATSSFLEIKQFALNKTNEIKTDITHKILRPSNEDSISTSTTTTTPNNNTTVTIENQQPIQQQQQPTHPIEILEKLTKQTYESLLLFKDNKQIESFEPMLQIWTTSFNSIEEDQIIPNEMIKEIITSCFVMGYNLNKCKNSTSSGSICRCWNEDEAKSYIQQYYQFLNTNKIYQYSNDHSWNNCIDQLLEFESSFTNNKVESRKVISTIYQFIDSNDISTCLTLLDSHSNDYGLLFRFIDTLLELDPIQSSKFYANQYPIILPRNILSSSLSNIDTIKFEYLNQLMKIRPELKNNSNLLEQWFICNLNNNKPEINQLFIKYHKEQDDGGDGEEKVQYLPKLKSNLVEWKSKEILLQIIESSINNEYGNILNRIESICIEKGFHQGTLKIYEHYFKNVYSLKSILYNQQQLLNYSKKLLELTIFTDDKIAFSNLFENNTFIEIWSNTLEIMKKLRKQLQIENEGNEEEDLYKFEISEVFILDLMGKAIGPLETIELVCKYSEMFEKSKIDSKILSDWIKFGKWSLYDRSKLSYDILSGLDSHLWLKKPLTMSPQILSMLGPEIDPNLSIFNPYKEFISSTINNEINNTENNSIDFKIPSFFEDNSRRHWGVETELSTGSCPVCTLPLAENPESSFLGSTPATIIVFPNCGHSYHHCCVDEGCILCFSKR